MAKNRQPCPCGSGKTMRRCCGMASSRRKLELEASARGLSDAGRHGEAARVLHERAMLSPQNPMIWNDLGVEHAAAGQPDEAHAAFRRALKALEDYPPSLYNLGRLAMERCAEERAKEHPSEETIGKLATEAIHWLGGNPADDPLRYPVHVALAAAYNAIGDKVQSRSAAREVSIGNPAGIANVQEPWVENPLLTDFTCLGSKTALPFLFSTGREMSPSRR